ncbi:MAG: hypothetical protein QGG24_02460 [Vicinamibacterales bacterium]|jgi:hypothetical protein|nr:hypothetical protein [Acidobacteriota bacterium]MDP7294160.1 hypothetical protein [Vicinamibacterales bacterium]MDP7472721.1 hypothetical protein [Vicinamibacterales bacterium]MDP7671601.1 hypothetical protein [Vicinamibacterales bacterium]HJO38603.1 hypothetical protein [Vicinamibacterales bacterium]
MTGRVRSRRAAVALFILIALGATPALVAQVAMPAPSEMSGIPLPSGDLPNGSVSVRLVREELGNNISGHPVDLHVAGDTRTVSTDEDGRALFEGIPASLVSVSTTVDGEALGSGAFRAPVQGGVRVMLVAGVGAAPPAPAPEAREGEIVFGGDTRWIVEMSDEAVEVYYLLEAFNNSSAAVVAATPVAFELPSGAEGAVLLEGTTTQARLDGRLVSLEGPLSPGRTTLNVAYILPYSGGTLTIEQSVPAAVEQVAVVAEKRGEMRLSSPQITQEREMNAEAGTFLVGGGPRLPAGGILSISLSGLPHHSRVPRWVALALIGVMLVWGFWSLSTEPRGADGDRRRTSLASKRERLFDDLVNVEIDHRVGKLAAGPYTKRRDELVSQLERLYRRLEPAVSSMPRGTAGLPG